MNNTIKTIAIALIASLTVIAFFAFKQPVSEGVKYEYKQFSTIESIVAGGLGRSRILTTDDKGQITEKDLENFFSMVGINFGNIAKNDRLIVDKINEFSASGWELYQVTTGAHGNVNNGSTASGIFITRYLFRKAK